MQLLMNVSRAVVCSFLASAVALQPRMRCCTFFEIGVAGTACTGGVAVTGPVSAWTPDMANAINSAAQREIMGKQ
jgi:hypothetical protein